MKKVKVHILTSVASADWSYHYGQVVFIDPELAARWVQSGMAENVDGVELPKVPATLTGDQEQSTGGVETIDIAAFEELKADEQKALLKQLEIEGDDSNEEKRIALYAAFLEAKKAGSDQ